MLTVLCTVRLLQQVITLRSHAALTHSDGGITQPTGERHRVTGATYWTHTSWNEGNREKVCVCVWFLFLHVSCVFSCLDEGVEADGAAYLRKWKPHITAISVSPWCVCAPWPQLVILRWTRDNFNLFFWKSSGLFSPIFTQIKTFIHFNTSCHSEAFVQFKRINNESRCLMTKSPSTHTNAW